MSTTEHPDAHLVLAALLMLPPRVRTAVLKDPTLATRLPPTVGPVLTLGPTGAKFHCSMFLEVVRQLYSGASETADISATDGAVWRVNLDRTAGITVTRDNVRFSCPELACIADQSDVRIAWLDSQTKNYGVPAEHIAKWRTILAERPLSGEELDVLLDEIRLTPQHYTRAIRAQLNRSSFGAADLVPADLRYFDYFIGTPAADMQFGEYVSRVLRPRVSQRIYENGHEGLRSAFLLSSHRMVSDLVDLTLIPRETVGQVFKWLVDHGDRISQVGAIECGLRHLDVIPKLEPYLLAMVRAGTMDDPEDPAGRLRLSSGLVALVGGEISRRNLARRRPPFWRRLAIIAHAALVEREVVNANVEFARLAEWGLNSGGHLYYMQSLVDLRQEPRWLPDFMSAAQLKMQFLWRISKAAEREHDKIPSGELATLLRGNDSSRRVSTVVRSASVPGPLDGGMVAASELPSELASNIRTSVQAEDLTVESFDDLINLSPMFRADLELSEIAAQGVARMRHRLRRSIADDRFFSLAYGLAMVSAITRSTSLATEVQRLCWTTRGRGEERLSPDAVARIALVAAAANADLAAWSDVVGEWMTELAFADMSREEAIALQRDLQELLHVEPILWETCGRAEAALSAFLQTFSEHAEETPSAAAPTDD